MNILSLFDGKSTGYDSLIDAGIKINTYYSSEVDKYANAVSRYNHPDIIRLGDVNEWESWNIDWKSIDLLLAGFPCQAFSFAGNQLGFDDKRGKLAIVNMDIFKFIKSKNPNLTFLFENVKMKKDYSDILNNMFGVDYLNINSNLVSAQNRNRLYWTNILNVKLPRDKDIFLKDIIESGVVDKDKSYCIDANYFKGTDVEQYIKKARRRIVFELPVAITERRSEEGKRIRKEYRLKYGRDFSPRRAKELVMREDGKMNCLTATYSMKEHTLIDEKINYRKLTPIECERLQTMKDDSTKWGLFEDGSVRQISDSQRYRICGNGWTQDVITHFFKQLKNNNN